MQIIEGKKFGIAALTSDKKVFVIHIAYLESKILIHPAWQVKMALLLAKKVNVPKK